MKYLLALIVWGMLSSCGGGGDGGQAGSGAISAGTYSGTGIGIWRYDNTSGTAARIDISIGGVRAGKVATLLFSNGSTSATSLPASGMLAARAPSSRVLADAGLFPDEPPAHEDTHAQMLQRNWAASARLVRAHPVVSPATELTGIEVVPAMRKASLPPAVGAWRVWTDNFVGTPVRYKAAVQAVCRLPSGRSVVWWVDPDILSSGIFGAAAWHSAFERLQTSFCGSAGGLAQLNGLLGDVWGLAASDYANSIQDGPLLQDIHVVVLNVPPSSKWAGYFFGGNNLLKSSSPNSNEALALFINASQMKMDLNFVMSTLLHEATHMVNFYQRSITKGVVHDTWLEETSAMMTEDIVAPAVLGGYNKVLSYRLPIYAASGGNVSYINWPTLADASAHYAMGGGFGAFLNRRYGLAIYQQLASGCSDAQADSASAALTSYACLDGLIKANGGAGFSDEFARFGATVFGQFPATDMPAGYGLPATNAGGYQLQAKDMSQLTLGPAAALGSGHRATSHIFARDVIGPGKSVYVRSGVVVPANTTLVVTIQ